MKPDTDTPGLGISNTGDSGITSTRVVERVHEFLKHW